MRKRIPFIVPKLPLIKDLKKDLQKIYETRIFTNMGPFEKEFESKCREYLSDKRRDAPYTIAVANGTLGLMLALKALEPKTGLVLLPSFTFAATVEAVLWCGYEPAFVDIDNEDWSLALNKKAINLIKSGRVGAVLCGNPFGIPADLDKLTEITRRHNLPLLIDSAAGMGSVYPDGTPMGQKGSAEVFSLHATKTFGIGEGGLVVTKNKKLAEKIQKMKNFGFDKNHLVQNLGLNAKMPEFTAVIALHVLKNYKRTLKQKRVLMKHYLKNLSPSIKTHKNILLSAGMFFPIIFPNKSLRDQKEKELSKIGVQTRRYYYPPLHKHPAFKGVGSVDNLRNTDNICQKILALPLYLDLAKEDIETTMKVINR